jgi:steroid delta-isomerase-like uncharacterized protein
MSTILSNLLVCHSFAQKMINQRDLSQAPRFIAEKSVHHEFDGAVAKMPQVRRGPEAMARFLGTYLRAFSDLRIVFEDAMTDRDRVVTRWRFEGTHDGPLLGVAPSGRRVSIEGIRIDRIENGKIAESWMQWDTLGMLQQVGVRIDQEPSAF